MNSTSQPGPSPEQVVPLFEPLFAPIIEGLTLGSEYADSQQPDPDDVNRWFWANCARYRAWRYLRSLDLKDTSWEFRPDVPNYALHACVDGLHTVRVLRTYEGSVPPPGPGLTRRRAFMQPSLLLAEDGTLPPLSVIFDWTMFKGVLFVNLSLPRFPWNHKDDPRLHWRVPVTTSGADLSGLSFAGAAEESDEGLILRLDDTEKETGE